MRRIRSFFCWQGTRITNFGALGKKRGWIWLAAGDVPE